jgi:hypothetical protein
MRSKFMKRGDTLPVLEVDFSYDNRGSTAPAFLALDPSTTVALFNMRDCDGRLIIDASPAQVLSSAGGVVRVRYAWQPGDTDQCGRFNGEFECHPLGGGVLTMPTVGTIPIEIQDDLD